MGSLPVSTRIDEWGSGELCRTILGALPHWFGIPHSVAAYVAVADQSPSIIARAGKTDVGITTLVTHSPYAAEVYVMGVLPAYHRQGVGRAMLRAAEAKLASSGVEFLQVKTLSPTKADTGYEQTRAFYLAYGFRPSRGVPTALGHRESGPSDDQDDLDLLGASRADPVFWAVGGVRVQDLSVALNGHGEACVLHWTTTRARDPKPEVPSAGHHPPRSGALIEASGPASDRDEKIGCRKVALPIAREDPFEPREQELLETQVHRVGPHALVVLAGEVDVSTVGLVYERLAGLARDGVCHASLNLSAVTFMDSTGMSMLVSEHKRMESMGGELILLGPPSGIRRLFQIAGLDTYFNIQPEMSP